LSDVNLFYEEPKPPPFAPTFDCISVAIEEAWYCPGPGVIFLFELSWNLYSLEIKLYCT